MNYAILIDFKGLHALTSRDMVRDAFKEVQHSTAILVDFSKVEFLSRTAAHELLKVKEKLAQQEIDVSFINLNSQVNDILELVQKSSGTNKRSDFRFVKWLHFENEKQYHDYLNQY